MIVSKLNAAIRAASPLRVYVPRHGLTLELNKQALLLALQEKFPDRKSETFLQVNSEGYLCDDPNASPVE